MVAHDWNRLELSGSSDKRGCTCSSLQISPGPWAEGAYLPNLHARRVGDEPIFFIIRAHLSFVKKQESMMLTKFICLCCNIGCNVSRYLPDVWEGRIDEPLFKVLFWDLLSKSLRCCRMYDESKLVNPAYISKKALSVHWTQSGPWIQFETQCERTPQFCDGVRDLQAGGENNIAKGEKNATAGMLLYFIVHLLWLFWVQNDILMNKIMVNIVVLALIELGVLTGC
jgi:hypothetical protein